MKIYINSMIICSMLLTSITAFAEKGSDAGNGGGAHFCSDGRVEMYDLAEGRLRFGKTIDETTTVQQAMDKVKDVSPWLHQQIEKELGYVETHLNVNPLIKLFKVHDADLYMTEKKCEYKQLANWDTTANKIHVDGEVLEGMNDFNQFVLKFHEAAYKVARDAGATDSNKVRRFVAEVFSTDKIETAIVKNQFKRKVLETPKKQTYSCLDLYVRDEIRRDSYAMAKILTGSGLMWSTAIGLTAASVVAAPVAGLIGLGIIGVFAKSALSPGKSGRSLKLVKEEGNKKIARIYKKALKIYSEITREDVQQIVGNGFISGEFCRYAKPLTPNQIKKYTLKQVAQLKQERK